MATGYKSFLAGAVLAAADVKDYLMLQSVMVFSSTSGRDSALSGLLREGLVCYITADDDFWVYDGSAWVRFAWSSSGGRTGFSLTASTQSIANNSLTAISYSTEVFDSDGFFPGSGTTATVPSGADGLYQITLRVGITTSTNGALEIQAGGNNYDVSFTSTSTITSPTLTICVPLVATNTIITNVLQILGSAQNVAARLDCYRIGR